jgi:hypothetical protein
MIALQGLGDQSKTIKQYVSPRHVTR